MVGPPREGRRGALLAKLAEAGGPLIFFPPCYCNWARLLFEWQI